MKLIKVAQTQVSYTAVMSPESIDNGKATPWDEILQAIPVPEGWKTHAHHMTLNMGKAKDRTIVDQEVTLNVVAIGRSEDALALQVSATVPTTNKIPHITVAVAPHAKPYQSNDIVDWKPVSSPMTLTGVVSEVKSNGELVTAEDRAQEELLEREKQQEANNKNNKKEEEKQKLLQMGYDGAKQHLQQQFPNLPEQAISGKLRGIFGN